MSGLLPVISLIPGLFCLGLVVPVVAGRLFEIGWRGQLQRWRLVGLLFASGILLDYFLVMVIGPLWQAMAIGVAIGICCTASIVFRYGRRSVTCFELGAGPTVCCLAIIAVLAVPILLEPLVAADARSIWFFQAKMIYFGGGMLRDAGWTASCCIFWHPDYPKLIPVLAAEVASLAGYWNEQLPKFSMLILLIPALSVTISYFRSGLAAAALFVIVWAKIAPELCSGNMDSPLAIYGLLGVLLIASGLAARSPLDFATGVLFVAITVCLKNEGSLLAVSVLLIAIAGAAVARTRLAVRGRDAATIGIVIMFAVVSAGSWPVLRHVWGIQNDLQLGPHSLAIIAGRLKQPGALTMIFEHTLFANGQIFAAVIGVCATGLSILFRTRPFESLFCLAVAAIYLGGIEMVYLATPFDLQWHLDTSADRTTLLPALLFLAPVIVLLRDEARWRLPALLLCPPRATAAAGDPPSRRAGPATR